MRKTLFGLLVVAMLGSAVFLIACEKKGPAEKAGEKVDKAVESTKEAAEDLKDKITGKGPVEKLGGKKKTTLLKTPKNSR